MTINYNYSAKLNAKTRYKIIITKDGYRDYEGIIETGGKDSYGRPRNTYHKINLTQVSEGELRTFNITTNPKLSPPAHFEIVHVQSGKRSNTGKIDKSLTGDFKIIIPEISRDGLDRKYEKLEDIINITEDSPSIIEKEYKLKIKQPDTREIYIGITPSDVYPSIVITHNETGIIYQSGQKFPGSIHGTFTIKITKYGYKTITDTLEINEGSGSRIVRSYDIIKDTTPTPQPQTKRQFNITTDPSDATISITKDGVSYTNRVGFDSSVTGSFSISISRDGYNTKTDAIAVSESSPSVINKHYVLEKKVTPKRKFVITTTPIDAVVKITHNDRQYQNNIDFDKSIVGMFSIEVSKPGYITKTATYDVQPTSPEQINLSYTLQALAPQQEQKRKFSITTNPSDAHIRISSNGNSYDNNVGFDKSISGVFTIDVSRQGYKNLTDSVTIDSNSPLTIVKSYTLERVKLKRRFTIATTPNDASVVITHSSGNYNNNQEINDDIIGDFTIVVSKLGYKTITETVNVALSSPLTISKSYTMVVEQKDKDPDDDKFDEDILDVESGEYKIDVYYPGYKSISEYITVTKATTVSYELQYDANRKHLDIKTVDESGNKIKSYLEIFEADKYSSKYKRTPLYRSTVKDYSHNISLPEDKFCLIRIFNLEDGYSEFYQYIDTDMKTIIKTIVLRKNKKEINMNILTRPLAKTRVRIGDINHTNSSFTSPYDKVHAYEITLDGYKTFNHNDVIPDADYTKINFNIPNGFDLFDIKYLEKKSAYDVTFECSAPNPTFIIEGPDGFYSSETKVLRNVKPGNYKLTATSQDYDKVELTFKVVDRDIVVRVPLDPKVTDLVITTVPENASVEIFGPDGFYSTSRENYRVKIGKYIVIIYRDGYDTTVDEFILGN